MDSDLQPVRILVVDDDALSREVFSLLLQRQGYVVETADSGEAALLHMRAAKDDLPRVMLVDMQMPGIAGDELARLLRELCGARTMLLAMSGSDPAEEAKQEYDGFLLKPFTMEELAAVIAGGSAGVADGDADRNVTKLGEAVDELDEVIYEKLAVVMRKDRLDQLYSLCLGDAERRIAAMRQAAREGDDDTYRREAHSIKGGCGMVGAVELQKLATSMEKQGLGVTNHVATLDEFILGCERLRRILVALEKQRLVH
jgi:CheY-like chemotaxis protein/HPt (histidine-containing phosphotransfer) domain-containing protein